jgi:exopolyphosphatase/guanosine-5'-triphosphate,3'-diphosphate pyrophosphatase
MATKKRPKLSIQDWPLKAKKKLASKTNIKLAAIDIGSNAIRLMLAEYSPLGLKPMNKYRVPIRLGGDVFEKGKISSKNLRASARAFRKFRQLMVKAKITRWRAVGTAALREAKNGKAFVELMRRKSGIEIEIIDGVEEAKLIHLGVKKEIHLDTHHCLLIDIGGGSIELTFSDMGMLSATQSFPFGTVRTIDRMKKKRLNENQLRVVIGDYLQPMSHYISSHNPGRKLDFAVGTGGNLEAIGRLKTEMLKKSSRTSITAEELAQMIEKLSRMTIKERIEKLQMRPDRADVILPAALIVQSAMRLAGIERLLIPYVGLKDGILWSIVGMLKR